LTNVVEENDNDSDSGISQNDSEVEILIPNRKRSLIYEINHRFELNR